MNKLFLDNVSYLIQAIWFDIKFVYFKLEYLWHHPLTLKKLGPPINNNNNVYFSDSFNLQRKYNEICLLCSNWELEKVLPFNDKL